MSKASKITAMAHAVASAGLQRHLAHVATETQRGDRTLLDLQVATVPTGVTPDAAIVADVERHRVEVRDFERRLKDHLARIRKAAP